MQNSTRRRHRAAIQQGKIATERFREAMIRINPALGCITEISQEEFVARRNKVCSEFYRFKTVGKGSRPLTKAEIAKI